MFNATLHKQLQLRWRDEKPSHIFYSAQGYIPRLVLCSAKESKSKENKFIICLHIQLSSALIFFLSIANQCLAKADACDASGFVSLCMRRHSVLLQLMIENSTHKKLKSSHYRLKLIWRM